MITKKTGTLNKDTVTTALKMLPAFPNRQRIEEALSCVGGSTVITIDVDLIHEIRDALLDEFIEHGLKSDYEPSMLGYEIEHLIDCLYVDELYNDDQ